MAIKDWSTTAANNNSAPPDGAPEGTTLVSDLNNIDREVMAQVRGFYEAIEWRDLGIVIIAGGGANDFVLTGDVSAYFAAGQMVKFTDGAGTFSSRITSVSVSTNTTITVVAAVTHNVTQVWAGIPIAGMAVLDDATYDPAGIAEQVVGLTATQTLTNKTLTSPVINVTSDAQGDIYYRDGSGNLARLAPGTSGYVLQTQGAGANPQWAVSTGAFTESYESSTPTAITGTAKVYTEAHGLSGTPKLYSIVARCTSVDNGYSVGDEVQVPFFISDAGDDTSVFADATNVGISSNQTFTTLANRMATKAGAAGLADFTTPDWGWIIRAYY